MRIFAGIFSATSKSIMKHMKVIVEIALYTLMGLLLGSVFFRQIVFSHFDLLLGDAGDARFNGVILEHWWQVLQGNAQWLSPTFFSPVQGVLGYGDAGFLNAFPYVVLRFLGVEPFTSYQIVLFALVAVGWIGTILFLRWCLKLSIFPAIIGATLFVFPNSIANSASMHTQLFTVYYIPYLAVGIYVFIKNFQKTTSLWIIAGIFVAILVPAIFYTSYYIGWFSFFFILLLSGVICVWIMLHSDGITIRKSIIWKWGTWQKILPYFALNAICFIPFWLTYLPALKQFGGRSYQEISSMQPSLIDYVNVGPSNWIWGKTLYSTLTGIGSRPMAHELIKGAPVLLMLTFLALLIYFIRTSRHYQLTEAQEDTFKMIVKGKETTDDGKLAILSAGLSIAVLLTWLLMVKIQDFSLWWLVTKLIPGADSIRAVYRFQHLLAFPLAIVVAIGLHQSIKYATDHIHSCVKRGAYLVALAVFCLLLIGEQFNTGSMANYSKQQQRDMLAGINPPPEQAKVFAFLPAVGLKKLPFETQIDAMIIAHKFNLHTINGYSGQLPYGWSGIYDINKPEYIVYLTRWIHHYKLETDQLYFLDAKMGSWTSTMNLHPPLMARANLMNGPLMETDFALELSAEEDSTQWEKNESRQYTLRVKNNGNVTLSSAGSDFNDPGKYAICLSYRWVEADNQEPLSGFDTRTALPAVVKPNAEITLNMEIKAPSKTGKYCLEIEAVQELVAWFKDKGYPGIRIEVDVQ